MYSVTGDWFIHLFTALICELHKSRNCLAHSSTPMPSTEMAPSRHQTNTCSWNSWAVKKQSFKG